MNENEITCIKMTHMMPGRGGMQQTAEVKVELKEPMIMLRKLSRPPHYVNVFCLFGGINNNSI